MILFFLQITITLLYDRNKNSLRLFIAHCNISASSLECNCMLRTTCLLADPLPNVTLILNDNADVTANV